VAETIDSTGRGLNLPPLLIVGLGNPGETYRDTRHNVGFMVLDELANRFKAPFREEKRWSGLLAKYDGVHLLKPQTYMNDSGRCVQAVSHFFKAPAARTLVIYDDVDLPLGRLRFRGNGGAAGHNGIRSLICHLGTQDFPRLKVGIAPQDGRPKGERMAGHVLGKFLPDEQSALQSIIQRSADAVLMALQRGLEQAMNVFNQPHPAV